MNLVKLHCCGEGYYSGKTYNETIFLLEEDYEKLNWDLDEEEVYIGELDGKHSEVYGEVCVCKIKEEDQENYDFGIIDDGKCLFNHLIYEREDITKEMLGEMMKRAFDYIESMDSLVEVTYKVKRSQVKYLDKVYNEIKYLDEVYNG